MIFKLILMILCVALAGSLVPILQYLKWKCTPQQEKKSYLFSSELFNWDLDKEIVKSDGKKADRVALADRGWVRRPMGEVLEACEFEEKRKQEYEKELP